MTRGQMEVTMVPTTRTKTVMEVAVSYTPVSSPAPRSLTMGSSGGPLLPDRSTAAARLVEVTEEVVIPGKRGLSPPCLPGTYGVFLGGESHVSAL